MYGASVVQKKFQKDDLSLHVRDGDLARDLDAWAERLNSATPDAPKWNRASVARAALRRALRERAEKGEVP